MRTTGNGLITQALIDTQKDASRTPYIDITINDNAAAGAVNYWSRLEYLEYHEEAYRDRAIIGLNNRDNALDALDLDGQEFAIKLGYDTTANGGGATDTVTYPTLWVKSHQIISDMGQRIYQIYAEGLWMRLREQKVVASAMTWRASVAYVVGQGISPTTPNGHKYVCSVAGTASVTEPTWPTVSEASVGDGTVVWTEAGPADPYSNIFNATHTVEEIIKLIIEGLGWTWTAVGGTNDGIIQTFKPVFEINQMGFENAAALLYRLIWMTKHYFRQRAGKVFGSVFPQTADAVDETYYSDKANWFTEYVEKTILLIPNSIVVLANQDPTNREWNTAAYPLMVGTSSDAAQITKYAEIVQPFVVGSINNQTDADNRAAAILTRLKAEILGGRLVAPHDSQLELYDKVQVKDNRT